MKATTKFRDASRDANQIALMQMQTSKQVHRVINSPATKNLLYLSETLYPRIKQMDDAFNQQIHERFEVAQEHSATIIKATMEKAESKSRETS